MAELEAVAGVAFQETKPWAMLGKALPSAGAMERVSWAATLEFAPGVVVSIGALGAVGPAGLPEAMRAGTAARKTAVRGPAARAAGTLDGRGVDLAVFCSP